MTLDEFQNSGPLVAEWRQTLATPIMQTVLSVLEDYAPVHRLVKSDISPTFANIRLGHQTGWAECVKTLTEGLLIQPLKSEYIEPTFENPDPDPQE